MLLKTKYVLEWGDGLPDGNEFCNFASDFGINWMINFKVLICIPSSNAVQTEMVFMHTLMECMNNERWGYILSHSNKSWK